MELDEAYPRLIPLAHERPGEAPRCIGFSRARSTLKDDVVFAPQQGNEFVVTIFAHVHIVEKVFAGVCIGLIGRRVGGGVGVV